MACSCRGACTCQRFTSAAAAGRAAGRRAAVYDRARDAKARAGLRPYAVCIVRGRSSGGARRGDGPMDIISEHAILPLPKVSDLAALKEILSPDQVRETGIVVVSEISASYTEAMLLGRAPDGRTPADEFVWWEITWMDAQGKPGTRRRFQVEGVPSYIAQSAEWTVSLVRDPRDT